MSRFAFPLVLQLACILAAPCALSADEPAAVPTPAVPQETAAERDARMAWFRDARFGMFIHWGLYSVAAGEWDGKPTSGAGEWIMHDMEIPLTQYSKLVPQFNPVKFDAREWVRIAKDAGMKYIVITTKHHDGFALYPSKLTDWCLKSTPFQRDPLKELAEACQEQNVKLCFYHSIMDWHHPDYEPRRTWVGIDAPSPKMDRYVEFMKGQLKELLTNYGPIGIIWFDGHWEETWNFERGADLHAFIRSLQPNTIVNNRVGKDRHGVAGTADGQEPVGDYGTPEQHIPATGYGPGVDWETCMTMNGTWGFKTSDDNWKSNETLVRNLVDIASKGGNYLLNVGPTAAGEIPAPSIERLQAVGQWMRTNGDAIYGTTASPCRAPAWGRITRKGDRLFLHVFAWPADGRLELPIAVEAVGAARLLADPSRTITAKPTDTGVAVNLTGAAPDAICSVVELQFTGEPIEVLQRIAPGPTGSLTLPAEAAQLTGYLFVEPIGDQLNLGGWIDPSDHAQWHCVGVKPGSYHVTAKVAAPSAARLRIVAANGNRDDELIADIAPTGNYSQFATQSLGELEVTSLNVTISLHPIADAWSPINVRHITLSPVAR